MAKKMQTFAEYGFYVGSLKRVVSSPLSLAKMPRFEKLIKNKQCNTGIFSTTVF
jgi:hypothetical protein|nr:MAG TPA: hypothetical protein [Caudoviricetes sp.]